MQRNALGLKVLNTFAKPVWSPDSEWVALGSVRPIKPPIEWELDGTIDLVMYNIETKETKVIKEGNQQEYYKPHFLGNGWGIRVCV